MSPRTDKLQNCLQFSLDLKPAAKTSVFQDFHANFIHFFDIPKKHTQLEIKAESVVEMFPAKSLPEAVEMDSWGAIDERVGTEYFPIIPTAFRNDLFVFGSNIGNGVGDGAIGAPYYKGLYVTQ